LADHANFSSNNFHMPEVGGEQLFPLFPNLQAYTSAMAQSVTTICLNSG
jgi:hypothetical protein